MVKRRTVNEKTDTQLTSQDMRNAIKKIDRRINGLDEFDVDSVEDRSDARIGALETRLVVFLTSVFGTNSNQYDTHLRITHINRAPVYIDRPTPVEIVREGLVRGIERAKATLQAIREGFEEQLEEEGESEAGRALRAYEGLALHPQINHHVEKLFHDEHYAPAVEASVKALNNLVKLRSGVDDKDGVALMQNVFSPKNPILQFNELADASDTEEQKGYMNMFTGAVTGLRNPRAHRLMKDNPERALEFIAFVSLLAKLVDETKKN
ncbi:MAG: TIGR02391 family protein [Sneathiella sp.]